MRQHFLLVITLHHQIYKVLIIENARKRERRRTPTTALTGAIYLSVSDSRYSTATNGALKNNEARNTRRKEMIKSTNQNN